MKYTLRVKHYELSFCNSGRVKIVRNCICEALHERNKYGCTSKYFRLMSRARLVLDNIDFEVEYWWEHPTW